MADDEPLCREVLETILRESGYVFASARNGQELLDLAQTSEVPVSCIITDWTMPGPHGPELVRELRRLQPRSHILVTSGFALNSLEIPEVDTLIQKPFGPSALLRVLSQLEAPEAAPAPTTPAAH
ncbi:MAG: response regulator [Blastochloris sp.]|nr:response regulator [Blastochloris sp.]